MPYTKLTGYNLEGKPEASRIPNAKDSGLGSAMDVDPEGDTAVVRNDKAPNSVK
jgi:hypothetical protein